MVALSIAARRRAAFWCLGRRPKRSSRQSREIATPPTPETAAKRRWPVWAQPGREWPSEIQRAAHEIDLAVRLIAGASICQAQSMAHIARPGAAEWSEYQQGVVRRYQGWRTLMVRLRWPLGAVEDVIVRGAEPADPWLLRRALHLHAHGQVLASLKPTA